MKKLTLAVKNFWNDEKGVTAIEYGLIAALIAVTIVISVTSVGTALNAVFVDIAAKLTAAL
ncbi:MAG: Flp family type IVb pilin [Nitrosomonas sp.]|nr:Flp family type IVb pilin [Nitrosomonas sp.]